MERVAEARQDHKKENIFDLNDKIEMQNDAIREVTPDEPGQRCC